MRAVRRVGAGNAPTLALQVAIVLWSAVGAWLLFRAQRPDPVLGLDERYGHAVVFAGLTIPVAALVVGRRPWTALAAGGCLVVAGGLVELAQEAFTSTRQAELGDVWWDAVGVLAAVVLVIAVRRLFGEARPTRQVAAAITWTGAIAVGAAVLLDPGPASNLGACDEVEPLQHGPGTPLVAYRFDDAPSVAAAGGPPELEVATSPVVLGERGLEFDGRGRVRGAGQALSCRLAETAAFTIVAELIPADVAQTGPTRIVAISDGAELRDTSVHLGIEGDGVSVRLRHGDVVVSTVVADQLEADATVGLALVVGDGRAALFTDAQLEWEIGVDPDFRLWDVERALLIGNDAPGTDRGLRGTVARVVIFDRPLTEQEIRDVVRSGHVDAAAPTTTRGFASRSVATGAPTNPPEGE